MFSYNPEPDEYVEAVAVLEDPWVILTRRDSTIATLKRPGFDVLHQLDLVAWTRRWRAQAELEDAWARRGIAWSARPPARSSPPSGRRPADRSRGAGIVAAGAATQRPGTVPPSTV